MCVCVFGDQMHEQNQMWLHAFKLQKNIYIYIFTGFHIVVIVQTGKHELAEPNLTLIKRKIRKKKKHY